MPPEAVDYAAIISQGSQSFAKAARLFDAATRDSVLKLYAWCRHCDDVIDGQVLGHDAREPDKAAQRKALDELTAQTRAALAGRAGHPAFTGLQQVVWRHGIPARFPEDHLRGFAMDVEDKRVSSEADLLRYCYGVAGVVGVMMAYVMGVRETAVLRRACDLGIAFQLTNIARDVLEDARQGRCYLPELWLQEAGLHDHELVAPTHRQAVHQLANRLVAMAEPYYDSAWIGIGRLPPRAGWAVASALRIYRDIGQQVVRHGIERRATTGTARKLWRIGQGLGSAWWMRRQPKNDRRDGLWTPDSLLRDVAQTDYGTVSPSASPVAI